MENSPASNPSDDKDTTLSGGVNVPAGISQLPEPTHSTTEDTSPVVVTAPSLPENDSGEKEKPNYRYEFTYNVRGEPPSFVVLWDTNDKSACERVLGRIEFVIEYNVETGNGFMFVDGVRWCFQKRIAEKSVSFGPVGTELETKPTRRIMVVDTSKVLEGLL